ncbi:ParA family protein [Ruania halotolerans]|uniref:ParA family protein n=1 Tax=Ruania halotolerans TaxID=2897773 RepID=UPI001E641BC5|nr:AAA family ATPase [Ruania halotolerans]UFU07031.1 AAA family ATPase [Ruania halotolerans]
MKIVAVYSTKGGAGKTSAAVNLAWEASRSGAVLLWDLDAQGASTYLTGVKPKLKGGVAKLVKGSNTISDVVREAAFPRPEGHHRIDVVPADDSYRELELMLDSVKGSRRRLEKALKDASGTYDTVILDCPPGASLVAENAVRSADVIVTPVAPAALSLRSLEQVRGVVADSAKPAPILAFLSMVDRRKLSHRRAVEDLPVEHKEIVDVVVPASVVVERMGSERAPVAAFAPRHQVALAYTDLWALVVKAA